MFKKTDISQQISMYSSVYQHLTGESSKQFEDETEWHNIFFSQVVSRIDENIFSVLYSQDKGSPNAPIRTLIGMMILKEGEGYSDEKLFENCRFNLLTRKALGLVNIDDSLPVESTYYLLRKRIADYEKETGINLFDTCFKSITGGQIIDFQVSGENIRTDSKLIGSNIAFFSRYELIHKTLVLFYKHTYKSQFTLLSEQDRNTLNEFIKEKSSATVYRSNKHQINERLLTLGKLIYTILNTVKESNNKHYQTLKQVFNEQYKVSEGNKIEITPNSEIGAKSVQSPHDTECDFRSKDSKKTKGYSHNITETCTPDNKVNLISDVQTEPATHPDNEFTIPAINNSQEILQDKIQNLHADGAYNSTAGQEFTSFENINFYLTGFQGPPGRYDLTMKDNELRVFDNKNKTQVNVIKTKKNKYRITTETGYRYFSEKEIESCRLRKQVEQLPKAIGNRRNNVEATIYQLAYHLRKDKTKYRGKFKNKIWAILRSLWVNFVRITKYLIEESKKLHQNVINTLHCNVFVNIIYFFLILTQLECNKNYRFVFR